MDRPLAAAFLAIQGLVLLNAVLHYPGIGYDAGAHLAYFVTLAEGRLPGRADTFEFFVPPLPYVAPALLLRLGLSIGTAAKAAQLVHVVWSAALCVFLIALCRRARPGDRWFPLECLLLLGMLPVYYRTMAFVRGEPLTAALGVAAAFYAIPLLMRGGRPARWAALGALLGLMLLAKQWGIFVLGAILLLAGVSLVHGAGQRQAPGRALVVLLSVTALTGGWFYLSLHDRFGSLAASNLPAQPATVTFASPGELMEGARGLFRDPVRETHLPPVLLFYADTWGDYWAYWVVHGWDPVRRVHAIPSQGPDSPPGRRLVTNRSTIAPYLGRANAVSILPTLIFLAGLGLGLRALLRVAARGPSEGAEAMTYALAAAVIVLTACVYSYMLLRYANLHVKASYMLHAFPFAAILGGVALARLRERRPRLHLAVAAGLALALLHNLPLLVTRYIGR